ncbi:MAG: type I DNA topoisomerase [Chloroflexi bacterium]|nr:type I DNA topoisomerase [Chloroflexota bacterium]
MTRFGETEAHARLTPPPINGTAGAVTAAKATRPSSGGKQSPVGPGAKGKAATSTSTTKGKKKVASKNKAGAVRSGNFRTASSRASAGQTSGTRGGGQKLVIVESPTKARTIGKFLGRDYQVKASVGHIRDLLRSRLSVDVEHDFEPTYRVPLEKRDVVKELQQQVKQAKEIYLATDPDREGEAIAWHLVETANIPPEIMHRVVFHEITPEAIAEAFAHPRQIDMELVNAQQARRILDRLVGYQISPLLWEKVKSRLSAGRVQSVAVRLVVEREREIQNFVNVEYWSLEAELTKQQLPDGKRDGRRKPHAPQSFRAKLIKIGEKDAELHNEGNAQAVLKQLEGATYIVDRIKKSERRRNPAAPFITSTLQQEASRRLGFQTRRTMMIAQQLYEGIDIGAEGTVGLITYMRTDSPQVAEPAQKEARGYIINKYGQDYVPPEPPMYKTRARGAQEAHEAIRPTSVLREPNRMVAFLSREQHRLYELIWKRFVASQMASAVLDITAVDIRAGQTPTGPYIFRATGWLIKFPGFLSVYEEGRDEGQTEEEGKGKILPPLSEQEELDLLGLFPEQHFTQPPPRYTEATLVKDMEEHGIGRPSTYAPIMSTIQERGYIFREEKKLIPSDLGFIVNDLLVDHFPDIVNLSFTAAMEENLDLIAEGEKAWVPVLKEFYGPFSQELKRAEATMKKVSIPDEPLGEPCPECGNPLLIKSGRFGKFIGCRNFPTCRYTRPILNKIGVICPLCGGDLIEKRTRRGRVFYGCSNYPTCEFSNWKRPLPHPCPHCGGLLVQTGKNWASCLTCNQRTELHESEEQPQSSAEAAG